MSKKTGYYLDTTDFDKGFKKIVQQTIPETLAEGMFKIVAPLVLKYAITEVPTVPKKWGTLRKSQTAIYPMLKPGDITLLVGFNTVYAAKMHEAPDNWNWTEPGSGPKFLISKLTSHASEFLKKLAAYVLGKAK